MTDTMLALLLLVAALAVVIGGAAHLVRADARVQRRAAWELDREAWRRWMRRP